MIQNNKDIEARELRNEVEGISRFFLLLVYGISIIAFALAGFTFATILAHF